MKAHIELVQIANGVCSELILTAPTFVGGDQVAKLRSPVAEMIDADCLVTQLAINAVQCRANNRRTEMPDAKRLGNVDGGKLQNHCLPLAFRGRAESHSLGQHSL